MSEQTGLGQRVLLAFVAFFAVLFDRAFADAVRRMRAHEPLPPPPQPAPKAVPGDVRPAPSEALHLLAVLQRDGRLIDFLQEDIAAFSDAEVGGAARTVHDGCRKALGRVLSLEPVYAEPDGASIVVEKGFDPAAVRLTGNVVGSPPFKGSLRHHGWRAGKVSLPRAPDGADPRILAPAEVELP
jgi:hypothetical protein